MIRSVKLTITEPWECSTESPIDVVVAGKHNDLYLLYLPDTIQIKAEIAVYLLAEVVDKTKALEWQTPEDEPIPLRMVYSGDINTYNFRKFSLDDFQSGFLLGQVFSG